MNKQIKNKPKPLNHKEIHKLAVFLLDDCYKGNDERCKHWITALQIEVHKK